VGRPIGETGGDRVKNEHLSEFRTVLINRRKELADYRQETKSTWHKMEKREKDYYDQANLESILAEISQLDERRWNEILQIDTALERIEQGYFGVCEICEEFIGIDRIRALPYARMCVQCAQYQERFSSIRDFPLPKF
jgi:DnaK suppressor protein